MSARQLLVVCVGNICRSPMAQALFATALPNWSVASAGLAPQVGAAADPLTLEVLGEQSQHLASHRARALDDAMVRQAEVILVMSVSQREQAERLYPWARGRIFRIGHWDGFDVPDPYQRPREAFEQVHTLLTQAVASWQKRL